MLEKPRLLPETKRVQLMATCLCDAFFADAAIATVQVLEHLGIQVEFPEGQTCCGQPGFNSGDWDASRKVVRHTAQVFGAKLPIVVPSASCAAMLFHGAPLEFQNQPDAATADDLAGKSWELADFIVNALGVSKWPGRFDARIAFHRSCHSRGTKSGEAATTLLRSIAGVTLAEFGEGEQCCGFGGTFSVAFPNVSTGMGELKLKHIHEAQPDVLVSGDMSCMMHLAGLSEKEGRPLRALHFAQVLRDSLKNAGLLHAA